MEVNGLSEPKSEKALRICQDDLNEVISYRKKPRRSKQMHNKVNKEDWELLEELGVDTADKKQAARTP